MEDLTNKIPLNNSIVDLKSTHNEMINRQSQHGYFNLIANGRFETTSVGGDIIDENITSEER